MRILILLLSLSLGFVVSAQESNIGEHVIYYLKDGTVLKGTLIKDGSLSSEITIFNGDTIEVQSYLVDSRHIQNLDHINLSKGRYFYKSGFHIDHSYSLGGSENGGHTNIDLSLNKRINEKLSVGIGISNQLDNVFFDVPLSVERQWININHRSTPIFIQGKYFLNNRRRRLYAHARLGYSFGRRTWWENSVRNNGFIAQYGIGLNKATRRGIRTFIQLNQSHSYGSGLTSSGNFFTNESQIIDYKIWFNRISFTCGVEFNLQRRNKKF